MYCFFDIYYSHTFGYRLYDFCFGKTVIRYRIENNSRTQRTVLGVRFVGNDTT